MIRLMMFLILIIFLLSNISAIIISEVELNPAGTDAGNEWVELYNDGEMSLEGYILVNNDGKNISLNGNFSGYYVYTFAKQWLDNSNESVSLYNNSELIDKTDLFEDSKNNDLTWQLCDGSWKFVNSTKGQENNCKEEIKENNTIVNNTSNEESINNLTTETPSSVPKTNSNSGTYTPKPEIKTINLTVISLNAQNIKSENNNENLVKNLPLYGTISFCVLFGALFLLKKIRRKKENEFR
jgi:hypothetical protein